MMSSFLNGRALRHRAGAFAVLALIALAGCSTKVGKTTSASPDPSAVITPIGHKASAGSGTASVAITVRSGAVVILSGKDSDGRGVALSGFVWTQTAGPALPLPPDVGALSYQTSNTVAFTAPQVAADTVYTFQLKVTNALSATATAAATVTVTAANDPNQFLVPTVVDQNISGHTPRRFVVAIATNPGLTPANLTGDVPACIKVSRQLSYQSRDGTLHDGTHSPMLSLPQLPQLQADITWKAAVGSVGTNGSPLPFTAAFQSTSNPRVVFDVPAFNDVELAALFNQPSADPAVGIPAATVNQQLVPSDVDSAQMYVSVSAAGGSCDGSQPAPGALTGVNLALAIYAQGGTTPVLTNSGAGPLNQYSPDPAVACTAACAPLTADLLLTAVNPTLANKSTAAETLKSATAYYKAIDPTGTKTTLNAWLDANCFDSTQADYGTKAAGANGAHATYTNNFDLGFGRDMYFVTCTASSPAVLNHLASAGDMASVVINYGSLEQTALKQAPILAVAMEYSADANSNGRRFPKFYAFAPDDRTGAYKRVSSANFDRRGIKYLPGACLSCHGGTITDTTFAATGDVDATFMPWDLDALLYSDTDPAFTGNLIGQSPYTRTAQEPNLKQLNAMAWKTYQTPEMELAAGGSCANATAQCVNRFAAPIALLTQWYGSTGPADPNSKYSDAGTPTGWPASPGAAPNDLYHVVYAHHCRSCHTQNSVVAKQFNDFKSFQDYLLGPIGQGITGLPNLIYSYAQMPLARLTMDRFWVGYEGSPSAAQTLANYINDPATAASATVGMGTTADAAGNTVVSPGAPVLFKTVFSNVNSTPTSPPTPVPLQAGTNNTYALPRFSGARVDFSTSLFVASYLSAFPQPPNPTIVGANNFSPAFDTSAPGTYGLSTKTMSSTGKSAQTTLIFVVTPVPPTASGCPTTASGAEGTPATVTLHGLDGTLGCLTPGVEPSGLFNVLQIQDPTSLAWGTTPISGGGWTASVAQNDTVSLTFNAAATPGETVTLNYRVTDVDGSDPQGSILFSLLDALTATNDQLTLPSAVPSDQILATALTANDAIVPSTDTAVTLVLSGGATTSSGGALTPTTSIGLTGAFTYVPPSSTFLTCDINGKDLPTGMSPCSAFDTFSYYLLSGNGVTKSGNATVSLNIQAAASFNRTGSGSDVFSILGNCTACHVSGGLGTAYWNYTDPATTYGSITGANTLAKDWTQCSVSDTTPCSAGHTSSAALYDNVCDSASAHYTAHYSLPTASCPPLLQWIVEGGRND
jgi:mono/diheme cytochrome c family protein